ncbi:MAG: glycosyltransferase family 2 protein [Methanomicrobiales archaeon]
MKKDPKLAIIILNWNNATATIHCLSLISRWSTVQAEVIVVDNGSFVEDISKIQQAGQPYRFICNQRNLGYAGGNNVGITFALNEGFPFIMLLNSDAIISEQCVIKLLECLEHGPDMGVVGPLLEEQGIVYSGGRNIGIYSNTRIRQSPQKRNGKLVPVNYVPGTVFIAKGEIFKTVGLLEEEYFFSGEVADFCQRVHKAGFTCNVFSGCRATHLPDPDSGVRESLYNYYILRNRFLFIRRNFPYLKYFLFFRWIAGGTLQVLLAFLTGRRERARATWFGLNDGMSGKFGGLNDLFLR